MTSINTRYVPAGKAVERSRCTLRMPITLARRVTIAADRCSLSENEYICRVLALEMRNDDDPS